MSHFTDSQVQALHLAGFFRATIYGVDSFRKRVIYSQLPQDDIEDVMSPDDIIMGYDEVIVDISADDGAISIESDDAFVGPIAANSELAEKILTSCF
jgi:hypothetical protein